MAENAIKSGWLSYSHEGFETLLWLIIAWLHKGIRSNDSFFFSGASGSRCFVVFPGTRLGRERAKG
jgi:hypothetical protein